MVIAFILGYGGVLLYLLLARFVFRPNVSRLETEYDFGQAENMTRYQKQIMGLTVALILAFPVQSAFPTTFVGQFLTKLGTSGIVLGLLMIIVFLRKKDGTPFVDIIEGTRMGVAWPVFYMLTIGMTMATAITSEAVGIKAQLQTMLAPLMNNNGGPIILLFLTTFLILFTNNFMGNLSCAMIVFNVANLYSDALGISSAMLACVIGVLVNASIVFSANPIAAVMHGMTDWGVRQRHLQILRTPGGFGVDCLHPVLPDLGTSHVLSRRPPWIRRTRGLTYHSKRRTEHEKGCHRRPGVLGRQPDTAVHMIRAADIQYLGCDYLAELTLSIMAKQQLKDPTKGFAPDFVARLLKEAGKEAWQKGIRITTNAGGMNVTGCVDSIRQWAEGQGIMAGHLLECGGQGAGGNYMYDWCHVPQMDELGFPIAELTEDSFHITKVPMSSRLRFPATGTTPIPIPFREKNLNGERESLYFANMNRNKKGITLNLKTQEGKELFKQLATFFTMWTTDWTRPAACGSGMRRKLINFLLMATDTFSPLRK